MKKILIVFCFTIIIIILFIIIMQKKSFWKGSDTKIAYWNFNSNILGTQKFSLAQTVNKNSIKEGYIAPGTSGDFEIVLDGRYSQVDILYKIIIEKEENKPSNIVFSTYISNSKKSFNSLKEMFEEINFSGIIKKDENKLITYKIFWEWPYENYLENGEIDKEKDKKDFEYGISNLDYTFFIKVEGVQSK